MPSCSEYRRAWPRIGQPVEQQVAASLRGERDGLTGRAGSGLPAVPERLPRAGQGVTHHRGHDVAFAFAEVRDQTARVSGAHAHGGAQSRLHLGGGEALDLKPGEEAPLALLDVSADRTARLPEQPFELRDQTSGFRLLLLRRLVRRDHLLGLPARGQPDPADRRSHQRQEARSKASFIAWPEG